MADESIFTKIIKGEIPSHKIYEDDRTFVFLDIHPAQPGHTLVVPKTQVEYLWDLSDDDYQAVMKTSKKVALRLREVLGVTRVGAKVIGVDVPHAHVQLIPFNTGDEYNAPQDMEAEPDHQALAELAAKLAFPAT
jgi:histidine triad (HIT) family protein